MPPKLSEQQVISHLEELSGWRKSWDRIRKSYVLEDFVGALQFVNRVGKLAEEQAHHPDITISYNRVTLTLSTHSAGGITEADFRLAAGIDGLSA